MNLNELEPQPFVEPMDSRFYDIPVEFVRDEVIDYVRDQVSHFPQGALDGIQTGLSAAEMFTTPSEFIDHIQFRKAHESSNNHWMRSQFDSEKRALMEHAWGTWAIEAVYAVMRLYWGIPSRQPDLLAQMTLANIYCKFKSED